MELVLQASHTHLYPGHEGTVSGDLPKREDTAGRYCRIEFSDGAVALATLSAADGDGWNLAVSPYRTLAGTEIEAKAWATVMRPEEEGGRRTFRIRGKQKE